MRSVPWRCFRSRCSRTNWAMSSRGTRKPIGKRRVCSQTASRDFYEITGNCREAFICSFPRSQSELLFPPHGAHARSSGSAGMLRRSVAMGELFWRWLRGLDLNQRPSGYEPDELPDCSTPRYLLLRLKRRCRHLSAWLPSPGSGPGSGRPVGLAKCCALRLRLPRWHQGQRRKSRRAVCTGSGFLKS